MDSINTSILIKCLSILIAPKANKLSKSAEISRSNSNKSLSIKERSKKCRAKGA
jgi:hypothetical protein